MAKKNVRVKIPVHSPLKFLILARRIFKKHHKTGSESPLNHLDMDNFESIVTAAEEKRTESRELRARSEALMEEANTIMGLKANQNSRSPGTVYNLMTYIKNYLLVYYHDNEEALSEWGFDVRIKASVYHKRKKREEE